MCEPRLKHSFIGSLALTLAACGSTGVNPNGSRTTEIPLGSRGPVQGVGLAGRDIASMTNQMARDLLASPQVVGRGGVPPKIIIDSSHFEVQGSQPLNRDLISQRLLVELNRAASGRITFVGRRHMSMIDEERELAGEPRDTRALGADFRLAGTFGTIDAFEARSGMQQRYNQVVFELIDLKTSAVVWTGLYEVERAGADDIVYR